MRTGYTTESSYDCAGAEGSGRYPREYAHGAVLAAREHQDAGKRWVVDMDLKQFFDEVDHDILMPRLGRKIKGKRLKRLLNAFLKAGVQCGDRIELTTKGTPQGGPLSPLLSNILLDDLDKDLFRRGRGRNLGRFTREDLNPVLRGWLNYFRLAETKGYAEDLDGWLRRRLRCILWRQWKRGRTRYKQLRKRGMEEGRARASAFNGRGAWWNSGASHMNDAFRKRYFDNLGLFSLLDNLLSSRLITT
ncbi:group II intron maturase-specific domain-containing protein [Trichloromonas sp.]|uniref:group II intron maturase-specific domain-containing protein n=1 Tax=Trichloromonas sp. TaxID=3069249 RepID=UPI003D8155B4